MRKLNLPFICILAAVLIIAITGAVIFVSIGNYGSSYNDKRLQEIQDSIISSISQCYALEGRYPVNLGYLKDHYGLQLDEDNYGYHYEMFASNIFPIVRVYVKGD